MATARFHGLSVSSSTAEVSAVGSAGEKISVGFISPGGAQVLVKCIFSVSGIVTVTPEGCV